MFQVAARLFTARRSENLAGVDENAASDTGPSTADRRTLIPPISVGSCLPSSDRRGHAFGSRLSKRLRPASNSCRENAAGRHLAWDRHAIYRDASVRLEPQLPELLPEAAEQPATVPGRIRWASTCQGPMLPKRAQDFAVTMEDLVAIRAERSRRNRRTEIRGDWRRKLDIPRR